MLTDTTRRGIRPRRIVGMGKLTGLLEKAAQELPWKSRDTIKELIEVLQELLDKQIKLHEIARKNPEYFAPTSGLAHLSETLAAGIAAMEKRDREEGRC